MDTAEEQKTPPVEETNATAEVTSPDGEGDVAAQPEATVEAADADEEATDDVAAEEEVTPDEPDEDSDERDDTRWYSLRVISGKERKIKERIEKEIERNGWSTAVPKIVVPQEKVFKFRNGKKVIVERNILPGYILVEAEDDFLNGETVSSITSLPNVMHFLGKNNPIPMRTSEADRLLGKVDESQQAEETMVEPYLVGETIKIVDGPFNGFVGDVQEINEDKKKLKVIVKIFGRGTEVELSYGQVEKQM